MLDEGSRTKLRRLFATVSGIVALVCFLSMLQNLSHWSFAADVVVWFLLWLSIFHFIFFTMKSITQVQIKLIDYPYLFIGALGIFLAASGNNKEVHRYYDQLDKILAPSTPSGLDSFIEAEHKQLCDLHSGGYIPSSFCRWSAQARAVELLAAKDTDKQRAQHLADLATFFLGSLALDMPFAFVDEVVSGRFIRLSWDLVASPVSSSAWTNFKEQPISLFMQSEAVYSIVIRSIQKIYLTTSNLQERENSPETDWESPVVGIGRVVFWPFVVAVALALRITKVTADVLGWAAGKKS